MNYVKKLQTVEVWLGHSVHTGCDIATPQQIMLGEGLQWVEREENTAEKGVSTQISQPQFGNPAPV